MKPYFFTDLAYETYHFLQDRSLKTREYRGGDHGELQLLEMHIEDAEQAERYHRPCGCYLTVLCEKIWCMDEVSFASLSRTLADEIWQRLKPLLLAHESQGNTVLVAGLGNAAFTVDAIGPRTVSLLNVTRHVTQKSATIQIAAMSPGVPADTGMEAAEQIRGVAQAIGARAILAVDSLAASDFARLGATVQITDSGICPGSGVGNARKAITEETMGVPVLAIGVPTVVDCATILWDALRRGGNAKISARMENVIRSYRGSFVCPKESDWITQSVSLLLASAIDRLGDISQEEHAYSEA